MRKGDILLLFSIYLGVKVTDYTRKRQNKLKLLLTCAKIAQFLVAISLQSISLAPFFISSLNDFNQILKKLFFAAYQQYLPQISNFQCFILILQCLFFILVCISFSISLLIASQIFKHNFDFQISYNFIKAETQKKMITIHNHKTIQLAYSFLLLILIIQCQQIVLDTMEATTPGNAYSLDLNAGDQVKATVSWFNASLDFNIYMYSDGQDLLKRQQTGTVTKTGYYDAAISNDLFPQILDTTVTAAGKYFVRVELLTINTFSDYKIVIEVNGVPHKIDYNTGISYNKDSTIKLLTIEGSCKIKLIYTGYSGSSFPINIYSPATPITAVTPTYTFSSNEFSADLTSAGTWVIVFAHGITSTTTFSQLQILVRTYTANQCTKTERPFATFNSYIPSQIYPVTLKAGDIVKATCHWITTTPINFDIYLYSQGQDLLKIVETIPNRRALASVGSQTVYVSAATSTSANPQILTYTVSADGLYYVRVHLVNQTIADYNVVIQVNGKIVKSDFATALPVEQAAVVKKFQLTSFCLLKVYYTGPNYQLKFFGPSSSIFGVADYLFYGMNEFEFPPYQIGEWKFVIYHGKTTATSLEPFYVNIKTFSSNLCQSPEAKTQFTYYDPSKTYIPSQVYPLMLKAGDKLKISCLWSDSNSDFDVYVYQLGQDLLTRETGENVSKIGYIDAVINYDKNPQVLEVTIPHNGQYYIRAQLFTQTISSYQLVATVNEQTVIEDYSSALPPQISATIKQFTTDIACKVKVSYIGPAHSILVYGPKATLSSAFLSQYPATGNTVFDLDVTAGVYSIVIQHGLTSTTTLTPYTLSIVSSDCHNICSNNLNYLRVAEGTSNICISNCSNIMNSLAIKQYWNNKCSCKSTYYLDTTYQQCRLNCSLVTHAIDSKSSNQTCSCTSAYAWSEATSTCNGVCGNGIITQNEECDDGVYNGVVNGCSSQCKRGFPGIIIAGIVCAAAALFVGIAAIVYVITKRKPQLEPTSNRGPQITNQVGQSYEGKSTAHVLNIHS